IKFDQFVPDQGIFGLHKIALDNSKQDASFLDEHLAYELHRWAGLPAPLTAHAVVSLNGRVMGIYVLKEPVDKQFLGRAFGHANRNGNLYEGTLVDFVAKPQAMELKN